MKMDWLADIHRDAGLEVIEHDGWKNRSLRSFEFYHPVGLINHHTAGSSILKNYPDKPFWPNSRLSRVCNITIRPDGVVCILNAGWAADSGFGDAKVLDAVRKNKKPPKPTDTYEDTSPVVPGGDNPGVLGNAWFIDTEVQHLGDGSAINPPQREALIISNAAICEQLYWNPLIKVLGHRGWTTRKIDPRWGGSMNPMPQIRRDTLAIMENGTMNERQEAKLDKAIELLQNLPHEAAEAVQLWGFDDTVDPAKPSNWQYQFRTNQTVNAIRAIVANFKSLDKDAVKGLAKEMVEAGVGQVVIDALVEELTD